MTTDPAPVLAPSPTSTGGNKERVRSNERVIPDNGRVLSSAVEVARDRARRNVYVGAHRRVAKVTEVALMGAWPQRRLLELGEIADMGTGADTGAWSQVAERADVTIVLHLGVLNDRRDNPAAVADGCRVEPGVQARSGACALIMLPRRWVLGRMMESGPMVTCGPM